METMSMDILPKYLDSAFRYFEKHERHVTRHFFTTNVLIMVFEGTLRFSENGIPVEVHAGEYYIQKHGCDQDGPFESDSPGYYWIHFHEAGFAEDGTGLPMRGYAEFSVLFPLLRKLEMLRISGAPLIQISAVLFDVFSVLYESCALRSSRSSVVSEIIAAVSEDIRHPFRLESLSEKYGYSKNHLINIFKKETGKTPHAFINDIKINAAKQLLLNSDSSLTSISVESGFGDYIYFYRVFLKNVGCSPAEWR